MFDRVLMVDWSAAAKPQRGANSLWAALVRRENQAIHLEYCVNFPTRHLFMQALDELVTQTLTRGERLLCGFDFNFGFPAGTAQAVTGQAGFWLLWQKLAQELLDGPDNDNNRFELADRWNAHYFAEQPRFWGRPQGLDLANLSPTKPQSPDGAFAAFRLCERMAKGAKSIWQLAYAGSVGSQSLLGMARLAGFLSAHAAREKIALWPFETGFRASMSAPIVFAEIYPSLFPIQSEEGDVKDAAQVKSLAQFFARQDAKGMLHRFFEPPSGLDADALNTSMREEGWILGLQTDEGKNRYV